jgi:hypothetical protein
MTERTAADAGGCGQRYFMINIGRRHNSDDQQPRRPNLSAHPSRTLHDQASPPNNQEENQVSRHTLGLRYGRASRSSRGSPAWPTGIDEHELRWASRKARRRLGRRTGRRSSLCARDSAPRTQPRFTAGSTTGRQRMTCKASLLTVSEAARQLGIGRSLLYELLPTPRSSPSTSADFLRIPIDALAAYIDRQRCNTRNSADRAAQPHPKTGRAS